MALYASHTCRLKRRQLSLACTPRLRSITRSRLHRERQDSAIPTIEAAKNAPNAPESVLCVVPACGGRWTRITDGKSWDDKPRWSPDGHTIYFLSGRSGFFDVWGIHFDPASGGPIGEPFRITSFESPRLRVSEPISFAGLSISHDRLALTLTESSGSIWMLDNVDR